MGAAQSRGLPKHFQYGAAREGGGHGTPGREGEGGEGGGGPGRPSVGREGREGDPYGQGGDTLQRAEWQQQQQQREDMGDRGARARRASVVAGGGREVPVGRVVRPGSGRRHPPMAKLTPSPHGPWGGGLGLQPHQVLHTGDGRE